MGMMEAVRLFFNRYTDFRGRSRRSEYWWVQLFHILVLLVPYILLFAIGGIQSGQMNILGVILMIAILVYALAVLIPGLAVSFRRLHDRDMSAWWLLIGLIPYLGSLVLLVFYVLPGTKGPNKYGPDPKNPSAGAADVFT